MIFQHIIKHIIITVIIFQINTFLVKCNSEHEVVKKQEVPVTDRIEDIKVNVAKISNLKNNSTQTPQHGIEPNNFTKNSDEQEDDIPDSFKTGFYILMAVGLIGLCLIVYKAFRLKMSRAERKYGVQGDRNAQELTPLPISIDEDSENEDQTIFELNRP